MRDNQVTSILFIKITSYNRPSILTPSSIVQDVLQNNIKRNINLENHILFFFKLVNEMFYMKNKVK